jgi:hypothetical protein
MSTPRGSQILNDYASQDPINNYDLSGDFAFVKWGQPVEPAVFDRLAEILRQTGTLRFEWKGSEWKIKLEFHKGGPHRDEWHIRITNWRKGDKGSGRGWQFRRGNGGKDQTGKDDEIPCTCGDPVPPEDIFEEDFLPEIA